MTKTLTIHDKFGLDLAAVYHQPSGKGPFPLVILCHGFTGWKEETHVATLAEALAAAGIAALRFDAPGSGQSSGTWAHNYRLSNYLADVEDVRKYAVANLPVDPKRIGIWGHSMGGFVALAAAANHPRQFAAFCGCQPSNGWKMVTDKENDAWKAAGWKTFSNSHFAEIKLPYAFFEDRQQYNALKETPQLRLPALFIAGTRDDLVPAPGVRAMYEAAPQPKQYLEFPAPHDYKNYPDLLAVINKAAVEFFVQHLG